MAESPQVNHAAQPLDHKTAGDVSYAAHLSVAPMMDWIDNEKPARGSATIRVRCNKMLHSVQKLGQISLKSWETEQMVEHANPIKIVRADVNCAACLSVAPMMDWTDRHCRYFHRLMSKQALLYTEMVTAPAVIHGDRARLLDFSAAEHPLAIQLGGSNPAQLAQAARIAADWGYAEVNLNCGCPSDRVQSGSFGAVLMENAGLVADCVAAMRAVVDVPVTVKCRIGVDDQVPAAILPDFLAQVSAAGCDRFTIHARKAWLKGLSPKENRDIPPLDYDLVHEMKGLFPHLHVSVNGGVADLDAARGFLDRGLDGVMIGRAAYHTPAEVLLNADAEIFGGGESHSAEDIVHLMLPYIEAHLQTENGRLQQVTRHMLGLFQGRPGARMWRRYLSENVHRDGADSRVVLDALAYVTKESA